MMLIVCKHPVFFLILFVFRAIIAINGDYFTKQHYSLGLWDKLGSHSGFGARFKFSPDMTRSQNLPGAVLYSS